MASALEQDLQHVLTHSESVWQPLARSNIFVTGGTGFVGSWLLESFVYANRELNLNARMTLLTRDPQAFKAKKPKLAGDPNLDIVAGDLKTVCFPAKEFRYVIHAAAEHEDVAANFEGTRRVLGMARTHGTRRLLFTSSGAVYGEQPFDIENLDEDYVGMGSDTAYAEAKRASETLCFNEAVSGLEVVVARLFAFVGPYLPLEANFAIGNFVRDALMGGPIRIDGDGTPLRSYLYAADLAIWLWILLFKGIPARAYNVGSDRAISILELARTVERVCEAKRGVSIAQKADKGAKAKRYVPSIERARTELGLEPLIDLDEGIRRTFDWHARRNAQFSMK